MTTSLESLNRQFEDDKQARAFPKYGLLRACGIPFDDVRDPALEVFQKAVVTSLTSGNDTAFRRASRSFMAIVERGTILGRLTGTTSAPPFTSMVGLTSDLPLPQWLAEGHPIPLARLSFEAQQTSISKFAIMLAFSKELGRHPDDRAVGLLERLMLRAIRNAEDHLLLSDDAAVAEVQPEGLLHNVLQSGNSSPADLDDDLAELWLAVREGDALAPFYVASPRALQYLATLRQDGVPRFPNLGPKGGTLFGVDVIPSPAAGNRLILIDSSQIVVTDEGAAIESSQQAAVQQDDAPTNNAATGTGAQLVSAFQTNAVFLRIVRHLHWLRMTDDAVGFIEITALGGSPS